MLNPITMQGRGEDEFFRVNNALYADYVLKIVDKNFQLQKKHKSKKLRTK